MKKKSLTMCYHLGVNYFEKDELKNNTSVSIKWQCLQLFKSTMIRLFICLGN